MQITVLAVPGCPNAPLLAQRLAELLGIPDIPLTEVTTPEQAEALGMTGSPTLLVDGTDPFAVPGTPPSLSCRLYRTPEGRVTGAPTVAALRAALGLD